ncbi:MAG: pyridoxal phosphate-dependent decarboxylase family protein [Pyrinomonadaceae bacterium]
MDAKAVEQSSDLNERNVPLEMTGQQFRDLGHQLIEQIAEFLDGLCERPVTSGESPQAIRQLLGSDELPLTSTTAPELLDSTTRLLFDRSLLNGHPRFWGYITSSPAPIGILADLLASAVNPNVGAAILSPVASEIEAQAVRWIADLIGFPRTCGGLLVSGGNMANFIGFLAGLNAKATWDVKQEGFRSSEPRPIVYVSAETHTWIEKAAELFGLGRNSVRWVAGDSDQKMDVVALDEQINKDIIDGHRPIMVIGAAGTVGTGAVDPLPAIAEICRKYDLWFHVDGAYGAPAAVLPDADENLRGLSKADSIALDPHKWLYSPLEAGCALVRGPNHLTAAFSHRPAYYNFIGNEDDPPINYHEFGLQNSRGFRALKVWLALRQVGRAGYVQMIGDDILLARALYDFANSHPELEAKTQNLSITTFRYVPPDLIKQREKVDGYLDQLNTELLNRLQAGGEAFVSNAVIDGKYYLRACIVNFRTKLDDVKALTEIVARIGRDVDAESRPADLR